MGEERNTRKVRQGVVVSAANDKTIVVSVAERKPHPVYKKMMTTTKKISHTLTPARAINAATMPPIPITEPVDISISPAINTMRVPTPTMM